MTKAERAIERQEKAADRLTASIDPVTGALQKLTAQQIKLDQLWQQKFIPDSEYKRLSGILAENEKALLNTGKQVAKTNAELTKGGLTAKQYANNLRGVPAQFTDIAVSLQAGQNPLTVFLQQGGQLKDMFGGAGEAARALGGYVVGLINPFTVAAAAAAVLALAYKQGSDEATAFNLSLSMTGNTAGTTTDQLADMARQVSETGGTIGKASAVLAQLAASTRIPVSAFESITRAAIDFESATGQAAEETVKNFEKIAKDPTAEILRLNESMNFLTASTYEQIKALQEQGKIQEAATLANTAYEEGLNRTSKGVRDNLGYIETGWKAVTSAAKAAWDAALNVGREETLDQQLKALDKQLNDIANARRLNQSDGFSNLAPSDSFREEALRGQQTQLLIQKAEDDRRAAAKGFAQQQQQQSVTDQVQLDKLRETTQSKAQKREEEIAKYRELVERRVTQARVTGDKNLLISAEQQAKDIAAIEAKYKDPKTPKGPQYREDAGQRMLDTLRQQNAALQVQSDSIDQQTGKYKTLGAQAKALAEFEQQIADIKTKDVRTADQKALLASEDLLRAQLKRNVALEQEIAARKTAYEDEQKLAAFRENQQNKTQARADANDENLAGLGMGEKARERLKEFQKIQADAQKDQDKLEQQRSSGDITAERYAAETEIINEELAKRLVNQQDYYNQVDEAQSSFFLGASEAWANWAEEAQNYSAQAAEFVTGTLDTLSDGLAESFMSILDGTKSVGEAFADLGKQMVAAIVGALVKMAAQWIVYQGVQLLVGSTTSAAAVVQAGITGSAIAAAYAPAAALASLASFGANSVPASAAIISTTSLAEGIALAGMAHDGIDAVPETGTWLLQKGERVTTASTSAKLDKTLDDVSKGSTGRGGNTVVNMYEDPNKAGQVQESENDQGERQIDIFVADLLGDGRTADALSRKFGLRSQGQ
ncbi:MAG: tail length tape measure protein [Caudoviricetes sp.]|nr:MAG: tail length tape measure protein [Caudoviricetes sp.]